VTPVFNTHRMVKEYNERLYEPAAAKHRELLAGDCAEAVEISRWKTRIRHDWPQVRISDVHLASEDRLSVTVGEKLSVTARVHLGDIDPKFVRVQAYFGEAANSTIGKASIIDLDDSKKADKGDYLYTGAISATESGAYGLTNSGSLPGLDSGQHVHFSVRRYATRAAICGSSYFSAKEGISPLMPPRIVVAMRALLSARL
jgi:starch phosphorylase